MRVLVLLVLIACKSKQAPPPIKQDAGIANPLPEAILRIRQDKKLPAIAFMTWRNGELLYRFYNGQCKATEGISISGDERWHLGSNTKAMTATLIGMYVDRGVVKFEDTIEKLFAGEKIHADYAKVTLEQLLRHTSGAPANPPGDIWTRAWADGDAPEAREKLVRAVLAQKPAHAAGEYVYSNTGYTIAGAALERVTKKRWEDMMREDIFLPLLMDSCGFGAPKGTCPWGHDESGTPIEPGPKADNPPAIGPAGTVHCSLADYGKFLAVHAKTSPLLVRPETLERLQRGQPGDYVAGWKRTREGNFLAHSGSNTMWYLTAAISLDKKEVFVIATNTGTELDAELLSLIEKTRTIK